MRKTESRNVFYIEKTCAWESKTSWDTHERRGLGNCGASFLTHLGTRMKHESVFQSFACDVESLNHGNGGTESGTIFENGHRSAAKGTM